MSDEPTRGIPGQDITVQSHRLARYLDRLPPGEYAIKLEKGENDDPYRVVIRSLDTGAIVRELWVIEREHNKKLGLTRL